MKRQILVIDNDKITSQKREIRLHITTRAGRLVKYVYLDVKVDDNGVVTVNKPRESNKA